MSSSPNPLTVTGLSTHAWNVFVGSPNDAAELRAVVVKAVNDLNGPLPSNGLMLRAVDYKIAASAQVGVNGQGWINESVVKDCHLLFAVFNKSLGSPVEDAVSGTVSEIQTFVTNDKGKQAVIFCKSTDGKSAELATWIKEVGEQCLYVPFKTKSDLREAVRTQLLHRIFATIDFKGNNPVVAEALAEAQKSKERDTHTISFLTRGLADAQQKAKTADEAVIAVAVMLGIVIVGLIVWSFYLWNSRTWEKIANARTKGDLKKANEAKASANYEILLAKSELNLSKTPWTVDEFTAAISFFKFDGDTKPISVNTSEGKWSIHAPAADITTSVDEVGDLMRFNITVKNLTTPSGKPAKPVKGHLVIANSTGRPHVVSLTFDEPLIDSASVQGDKEALSLSSQLLSPSYIIAIQQRLDQYKREDNSSWN